MAQIIKLKRSSVQGKTPTTTDLDLGEIGINTYDGKLFIKKDDGTAAITEVGKVKAIDDLSDVDVSTTSPSAWDLLMYDGSDWVPYSVTENDFTATAGQTAFTVSSVVFSYARVYTNGIRDKSNTFSISDNGTDTTVTFTTGKNSGDWVLIEV